MINKGDEFFKLVANWSEEWGITKRPIGIVKDELRLLEWDYINNPAEDTYIKIEYIRRELDGYGYR